MMRLLSRGSRRARVAWVVVAVVILFLIGSQWYVLRGGTEPTPNVGSVGDTCAPCIPPSGVGQGVVSFADSELAKVSSRAQAAAANGKLKVLVVMATRPDVIKLKPVIDKLRSDQKIEVFVLNNGQHKEMVAPLLDFFKLEPELNLDLMVPGQSLSYVTQATLYGVDAAMTAISPHLVVVQGDTSSAMAAGTAAFLGGVPVAHVEAGLRTYRLDSPFPEEFNRRVVGQTCSFCFAPTVWSGANLLGEGVDSSRVFVTGNSVIDAINWGLAQKKTRETEDRLREAGVENTGGRKVILVTTHRRESFGGPMTEVCEAVAEVARKFSDKVLVVFPVHLNPEVRKVVNPTLGTVENIRLIEPMPYDSFIHLIERAAVILTDSGGIQEEATALGKPILVARETTERPEGVKEGVAKLVGTTKSEIVAALSELLENDEVYKRMSHKCFPYGRGMAAEKIHEVLARHSEELRTLQSSKKIPMLNFANPKDTTLATFDFDKAQSLRPSRPGSIAVILTQYKRTHTAEMLKRLAAQTVKADEIWVYQNEQHEDLRPILKDYPDVRLLQSWDYNFKFHGRFVLPLLLDTEYVAIFDDDVYPGKKWLENVLRCSREHGEALCGDEARNVNDEHATEYNKMWTIPTGRGGDEEVDFVGHGWFFPRRYAQYFWTEHVPTWANGEDISLSAAFQIRGGVKTYIAHHPPEDREMWGDTIGGELGKDEVASWRKGSHHLERVAITRYWMTRGWIPLKNRNI